MEEDLDEGRSMSSLLIFRTFYIEQFHLISSQIFIFETDFVIIL